MAATDAPFDLVGVGFGPSNLALAIAVAEFNERVPPAESLRVRFVERQEGFGWHRGMLLEDATMQVSYLKDLVTLRNPASSYSFLSYLHSRDRLVDFINVGSAFPTRVEFHDYLEWAAGQLPTKVDYGTEVVGVAAVEGRDEIEVVGVHADGRTERLLTRNIVVATGLTPTLPDGVALGPRVWHSRDLVPKVDAMGDAEPERLVVVGAGQSAAESVDHLHRRFPSAQVCAVFARYGYSPADDSAFANRVFDPSAVDDFHTAPEPVKQQILEYHANTNYSVVDPELITSLYRRHYQELVAGQERLRILNVSRVAGVREYADRVEVEIESMIDAEAEVLVADAIVYATGYRSGDPTRLLGDLGGHCEHDEQGRLVIGRDYRVATGAGLRAGVYVQGATEHTHGLSSTLLSNVAVRAGEIVHSLVAHRRAPVALAPAARA